MEANQKQDWSAALKATNELARTLDMVEAFFKHGTHPAKNPLEEFLGGLKKP